MKKLRSASRRTCLCRAVPCCHSKPSKTYNFEETRNKKSKINGSQLLLIARVCSCAKSQWPFALLIWNWHCNDGNNHQISSLKEKKKLKTAFTSSSSSSSSIFFFFVMTFFLELNYYLFNVCLLALTTMLPGWPVFGFACTALHKFNIILVCV